MDTFLLILRILFLVIGSLVALVYILFQFYQKINKPIMSLSTADYLIYAVVALLFGFGTNSYIGLAAFVPLLLLKFVCRFFLTPKKLSGSGRWMEIDWKRLTPKGYERVLPAAMLSEMNKMPKDAHFVIPKLYFNIFIYFIRKKIMGEAGKMKGMNVSAAQQNLAMNQFSGIIDSFTKLNPGQTEYKNFPFGILKVTRL